MKKQSSFNPYTTTLYAPPQIGDVVDLAWEPNGKRLAAVSRSGYLCVWSTIDGTLLLWKRLTRTSLLTVAWARQGNALATGSADGWIYRVENLKAADPLVCNYPFPNAVTKIAWSPSPVGRCLVLSGPILTILDERGGEPLQIRYPDAIQDAAWAADGRTLAVLCRNGLVEIWDANVRRTRCSLMDIAAPRCLSWHRDGRQLAVGTMTGQIQVCDLQGQELQRTPKLSSFPLATVRWGKTYLAVVSDQGVALWDGVTLRNLDLPEKVSRGPLPLIFDPQGEQVALSTQHTVSITALSQLTCC